MRKIRLRLSMANKNPDNPGGKLFKVFFKMQDEGSFFEVKDKILTFEMQFEEMPADVIEVISSIPFDELEELTIEDVQKEPTIEVVKEDEVAKEETELEEKERQPEKLVNQDVQSIKSGETLSRAVEKKRPYHRVKTIPEIDLKGREILDNIANRSVNFDDFVQRVGDFIKVGDTYRSLFNDMVYATTLIDSLSWSEIIVQMKNPDGKSESKRIVCTKKVADAFRKEGSSATILVLLKTMVKYKDYDFVGKEKESKPVEEVHKEKSIDNGSNTEGFSVFSKELLEALEACTSFEEKVAVIVDMIKPASINDEVFQENRTDIVDTLVELAKEFFIESTFNYFEAAREANVPEEKAHVVQAFIIQSIRDYCTERNVVEPGAEQKFFEDLIKLM